MSVVAVIQARMSSSRLPGKVLEDLAGQPMLARVVNRTCRARTLDAVAVATTVAPADDPIVRLCDTQGWICLRGSEDDVLDRYYQVARALEASSVVRITADCPLIDPDIIDRIVGQFLSHRAEVDYVSNTIVRSFPRGLDVEVMNFDALEAAWHEDSDPGSREHVTPYIRHHPDAFRVRQVVNNEDCSHMRWTVDTVADLMFVSAVFDHFRNDRFTWKEGLRAVADHPEWAEINRHVQQRTTP